jgi:hypothetical protein
MSVHDVDVHMSLGKHSPLEHLQKMQRFGMMYLVQLMPDVWNVVIAEVRHEQQIVPTSARPKRLDAHIKDL